MIVINKLHYYLHKIKKMNAVLSDLTLIPLANPNPVLGVDRMGVITFANHGSEIILAEWKVSLNERVPPEWREIIHQILISKKIQNVEMRCGEQSYILTIVPKQHNFVNLYGMEITPYKNLEKELLNRAISDEQTKLPNRVAFKQSLDVKSLEAKRTKSKLGILVARIDDFSQLVYTYGQEISSQLLYEFSQRLTTFANKNSTIARISESEFGLLEPKMTESSILADYVTNLIEKCTQPYFIHNRNIVISISIGITICPNDGDSAEILSRNAQLAVNRTSDTRNQYEFFQRGMEEQIQMKRQIIADLHDALGKQQFELFYQPQIHLQTQELVGCEALIRWKHPQKGYISPFYFIPAAEEGNLIMPIGEWVLNEACGQIAKWKAAGFRPIKVAVNLSARQILKAGIIDFITETMNKNQVTEDWLALELTESALVEDQQHAIEVMKQIKSLGLDLALDDFGTGYSSLSYLLQFPIDKIKIDRSFVKIIENENDEHAVTKGIIDLGHSMGLAIVVEGVETAAQLNYFIKHKCDIIQGFIFGKPEPAEVFEKFYAVNWKSEIERHK
ncbi:EAL domain-containing protein [Candidatus Berkiella cookevillensis]|nr:bifunctional diguanylate cyclase/phosphodiesterase [Candidatus Berkiella cookevillensis]MCS5708451.1 EAL domain-containing protein [Candidatus Berkiella cookevillensis]